MRGGASVGIGDRSLRCFKENRTQNMTGLTSTLPIYLEALHWVILFKEHSIHLQHLGMSAGSCYSVTSVSACCLSSLEPSVLP